MSGNPSSPPPRDGGGGGPRANDCDLKFRTTLASPVAAVVARLSAGDMLDLRLDDSSGTRVVVATTAAGHNAGSIVDHIRRLIRCIQEGNSYNATVRTVTGGAVVVDVARAP